MPRQVLPVAIAIAFGLIVIFDALVPSNAVVHPVAGAVVLWAAWLSAFALLLGMGNIIAVHLQRIGQRSANSIASLVVLVSAGATFVLTLPAGPGSPVGQWIFQNLYRPLESSFLALLAFFIFSAAYRSARARSWEMVVLLLAAVVVLLGQVPITNLVSPWFAGVKDWVLNVPAMAGVRGILIGVALGTMATALRLLVGLDRPYAD